MLFGVVVLRKPLSCYGPQIATLVLGPQIALVALWTLDSSLRWCGPQIAAVVLCASGSTCGVMGLRYPLWYFMPQIAAVVLWTLK